MTTAAKAIPWWRRGGFLEIVQTVLFTLILFVVIQTFVAQPYQVQGDSMDRTLAPDQFVLVDKLTPRFDVYARGDIVVFHPPAAFKRGDTPFIKRVIGVAGDTVEIRAGRVAVNGTVLDEPYAYADPEGGPPQPTVASKQAKWTVPPGDVFLLGDHRAESEDSRIFGPVAVDQIVGRAWLRYWPLDTFGILPAAPEQPIPSAAPAG